MSALMPTVIVITDANVLINLLHIGKVELLAELPGFRFKVPPEVLNELTNPQDRAQIDAVIAAKKIDEMVVSQMDALTLFAELRDLMGRGEAACLALAATSGCHLASDEKKRFKRKAIELIGEDRLLRTESLIVLAIRAGRLTVAQADECKGVLAEKRYAMPFKSFAEVL
jgi:predicted nucleic acid-binding protein